MFMEQVFYSNLGKRAFGFAEFRCRRGLSPKVLVDETPVSDVKDAKKTLFENIFAINPITKLPDGDILAFMNSNTPPEVARFIEQNLMYDNGLKAEASGFEGLDDDTIAELTRNSYERLDAYAARCFEYVKHIRKQSIEREV